MYSPKIIAQKATSLESQLPVRLKEHSVAEVVTMVEQINSARDRQDATKLRRPLTEAEKLFIHNEILLCGISYPYWATRYAMIKADKGGLTRIRFWESQDLMLGVIAEMEEAGLPIKIVNLKARQIGASTLWETLLAHKCMNRNGYNSLIAADEPQQSHYLFSMMLRIYDSLPFWLQPHVGGRVKGTELFFDKLDSAIYVDSGNKRVGGLGQGKTIMSGHLSEIATWENAGQVTEDLVPSLLSGESPHTIFVLESTARGYNHWHDWWKAARDDQFFGFRPVFIPWYAITEKYAAPPPSGWGPSDQVQLVWASLKTRGVELTRKQMYWWDKTYASYKKLNKLNNFYAEYASDEAEAFQLSGTSVFSTELIQQLRQKAMARTLGSAAVYNIEERDYRMPVAEGVEGDLPLTHAEAQ